MVAVRIEKEDHKNEEEVLSNLLKKTHPPVLIFVVSKHCGFCQMLEPVLESIMSQSENDSSIAVAKIESDYLDELDFQKENPIQVRGVPTIVLSSGEKVYKEYGGDRSKSDLLNWYEENKKSQKMKGGCGCGKLFGGGSKSRSAKRTNHRKRTKQMKHKRFTKKHKTMRKK